MDKTMHTRGWCSPERYVQGPGEFKRIRSYTDKFGKRIAVFIDQFFYESFKQQLEAEYNAPEYFLRVYRFDSEVTRELIEQHANEMRDLGFDLVVGVGGGKTIDVSKGVGTKLGKPFIIVPTAASTDAPTSSLSVIYRADGSHEGEFFYDHSPSLLVVDSEIIANGPTRLLVSGMGDALATLIEADATRLSNTRNLVYHTSGGSLQTLAGQAIARTCHEALMKYGRLAKLACDHNVVTPALENIIETNILLSGLGFENNATAGAHSVNDGLTAVPGGEKTMHGEKVAFGCLVQLIAENAPAEKIEEITDFCIDVGLPVCFDDLGVEASDENMRRVAEASMHSNWANMPFEIDADGVYAAIKTADAYGKLRKKQRG